MNVEEEALVVLELHNTYGVTFVSRRGNLVRERWECRGCGEVFSSEVDKMKHKVRALAHAGLLARGA